MIDRLTKPDSLLKDLITPAGIACGSTVLRIHGAVDAQGKLASPIVLACNMAPGVTQTSSALCCPSTTPAPTDTPAVTPSTQLGPSTQATPTVTPPADVGELFTLPIA